MIFHCFFLFLSQLFFFILRTFKFKMGIFNKINWVKITKIFGGFLVVILALMLLLPVFFKDTLQKQIKVIINSNLNAKVDFKDVSVSFFSNFPALTVGINEAQVYNLEPFVNHKLIHAEQIGVGVNVLSLFSDAIIFDKIFLNNAEVSIKIDSLGQANYNIFKPSGTQTQTEDTKPFNLKINTITINHVDLDYDDQASPMFLKLTDFNYVGKGDLQSEVFELASKINLKALDFSLNGVNYVEQKPIKADILTTVDAKQLRFTFNKNNILIKDFPFSFDGFFAFIENGYDLDLNLKSQNSQLGDLLSLVPPSYQDWLEQTKIKGELSFQATASGKFSSQQKPIVTAYLQIVDGYIANKNITNPIHKLNIEAFAEVPNLDPNQLKIDVKYLDFLLNNNKTHLELQTQGIDTLWINSKLNSKLNLADFQKAIGFGLADLKGDIDLNFVANGTYKKGIKLSGIRQDKKDTIITSIPTFLIQAQLKDGYFKHAELPDAINAINFNGKIEAKDSLLQNVSILLDQINITALSNYIKGKIQVDNLVNYQMNTALESKINLGEIAQFYPLDSIVLKGNLEANLVAKGAFKLDRKELPATKTILKLKNGYIKSLALPELPIENIDIETHLTSLQGKFKDLRIEVLPINFEIAGAPFRIDANLYNLEDLNYNINSKGILNIGNLYKIFKLDGLNVDGIVKTNLNLKGITSDATSGKYYKLQNKGSLEVQNIAVNTDIFPQNFFINNGKFTFFKDKMKFDQFNGTYGKSSINVNGQLDNVIHYIMANNRAVKGDFTVNSSFIDADEFMVFNTPTATNNNNTTTATGVILVPQNIDVNVKAQVNKIKFNGLELNNFNGSVQTKNQSVNIPNANFNLAGTKVNLAANYKPVNVTSATFAAQLKAENFDIQKAYKEVDLFKELVSMAKDAHGIVSLNYDLTGKLNQNMDVVLPSIKGKGTLTLEDIKFKNFKLLNAVAQKSDAKSIKDSKFSKVEIKTTIENNVMKIDKTKFKMAGFRGRLQGQATLDGKMNIGFRLGLPPLGIFGIPMKITGNSDNFKVSIGKYKENQDLETTEPDND